MDNKAKIYIAGPISNNPEYKKHFDRVERELNRLDYIVLNPSILPKGLTQEEYMRICIPMLNIADSVYMLKGWEDSVGARIEHALAKQANKTIWYEDCINKELI